MTVLLLGATGRTGKHLLNEFLSSGFSVHVIVRNTRSLPTHPELVVFEGSPSDSALLESAIKGCSAVVSALNISRTSDFPWARLRSPQHFLSEILISVLALSRRYLVKRIVVITAWGTQETKWDLPVWFRWLIDHSNLRYPYHDHERQEEILKNSDTDWTVIRPVGLTNSEQVVEAKVSLNGSPRPGLLIGRKSVARFAVKVLKNNLYIHQLPVVFG